MSRAIVSLAFLVMTVGWPFPARSGGIPAGDLEFFEKEVRPVLVAHCYDCHSQETKIKGGLLLDSKLGILAGGDSGRVLVPGQPEQSRIIAAVRYHDRDLQMPPKNRLTEQEIAVLEKWVRIGAPDPREETGPGVKASSGGMSIEEGRNFWSFLPVKKPPLPEVSGEKIHPVDAFILAQGRDRGFSPAPAANKRELLRRVTFDLTGLPPTPEEISQFLSDDTPEAYEKVIDRLLASKQYGVKWGRHWLDVARYADSNGLDENLAYGQAWRYRDYVVAAFNNDKPYDQFLTEQIAGDLVPGANQESKTATGFLALGAKVLAEPDRAKLEMDIIDEQLDTLGKAFLGMTFGCARCHDHKFDPVKQTDYYALAAIFKSTASLGPDQTGVIKHWFEHSFSTEEEKKQIAAAEEEIKKKNAAASGFAGRERSRLKGEARSKAVDYLVAATGFDAGVSLEEVEKVAHPFGLHPRVLHHGRLHLDYHRDDPFFRPWHQFQEKGDLEGLKQHYSNQFAAAEAALVEARKKDPKAAKLDNEALEQARAALYDDSGFLTIPAKAEFAFSPEVIAEYHRLLEEARIVESAAPDQTTAMGVGEAKVVPELPVHIRGSHKNLGPPVSREFPEVMRLSETRPIFPAGASGRLQLARWMADSRHPLTARVIVNRIWGWHFGQALCRTTENFGVLGERPSHPELLDWLAHSFMENNWSFKSLHRLILTSHTYQQASQHPQQAEFALVDPENRLLWKFNLRRLEAEEIRDAFLSVSGRLDPCLDGKTVPLRNRQFVFNHTSQDHTQYDSLRRALYLPVIRNHLYTFFEQFDYPDPTMPTGARNATVIAPQALILMNDELVMASADALARRVLALPMADSDRVARAWEWSYGRLPTGEENRRALGFLEQWKSESLTGAAASDSATEFRAWSMLCQGLFASNEFVYLP